MTNIELNGLTDSDLNGSYVSSQTHDGQPFYKNLNAKSIIIYKNSNLPYTTVPAYYIEELFKIYNSIPLYKAKFVNYSTDVINGEWKTLLPSESGETNLANLTIIEDESPVGGYYRVHEDMSYNITEEEEYLTIYD